MTPADIDTWNDRRTRRRRAAMAAGIPILVLALLGGYFYVSGGYDDWRTYRALSRGCDGLLPVADVRALFPGTALATDEGRLSTGGEFCGVHKMHDGLYTLDLNVSTYRAPGYETSLYWDGLPLGHGWTGSFSIDNLKIENGAVVDTGHSEYAEATVAILLDCGAAPGDGLYFTVNALIPGSFKDRGERSKLVTVATGIAKRGAELKHCAARTGEPVPQVGLPPAGYENLARADGSCAGLLDAGEAGRLGVSTVQETAAEPAPHEQCVLGDSRRSGRYAFNALYGPMAHLLYLDLPKKVRGYYTAEAKCPGAQGAAVYTVEPVAEELETYPLPKNPALRAPLQRFAEKSAAMHGCSKPVFR